VGLEWGLKTRVGLEWGIGTRVGLEWGKEDGDVDEEVEGIAMGKGEHSVGERE
jgi:hypothetical protein